MPGPILSPQELEAFLAPHRARGARIVLTNGCFDLLHVGHLRYLRAARALGDLLVVGINDDASVRALKGPGRPLIPLAERAELLAALAPVDAVVPFGERTADRLLERVRPDLYVKGGDYTLETLPEAATARRLGVEVRFLPLVKGRSTSGLIAEIVRRFGGGP